MAKDQFRFRGSFTSMSFERDSAGNVAAMVLDSGGTTSRAPKTDEQPVTRTAIAADPAKLDRYTGSYEPGPGLLMVISRKGNALAALVGSGQREFDLFAESESTWFAKAVDIELVFTFDATGKANGFTLNQGGRSRPVKKLE